MSAGAVRMHDPFGKMLAWSGILHGLLLVTMALAVHFRAASSSLPTPVGEFINVSLGQSGPLPSPGSGGAPPAPEPEPEPEPPPKKEPEVVRPTKEQREELPMPDAPTKRKPRWEKPKQDSGLRGADAASAASADLERPQGPSMGGLSVGAPGGGSAFGQDFQYTYYLTQMIARIHQHWQKPMVRGQAEVIVQFLIARDGSVSAVEVEKSSGVRILDRQATRAVMLSDPLPPLPNTYSGDSVRMHLRFEYVDR